jgi:hypothetical protein
MDYLGFLIVHDVVEKRMNIGVFDKWEIQFVKMDYLGFLIVHDVVEKKKNIGVFDKWEIQIVPFCNYSPLNVGRC